MARSAIRRSLSEQPSAPPPPPPRKQSGGSGGGRRGPGRIGRFFRKLLIWGLALCLAGVLALAAAVMVAASSLPGYQAATITEIGRAHV